MTDKEINKRLDEAFERLFKAQEHIIFAKQAIYDVRVALAKAKPIQTVQAGWISVQERIPADDKRVVVRTFEGATYFLHPIGGKFPKEIKEWYELPE